MSDEVWVKRSIYTYPWKKARKLIRKRLIPSRKSERIMDRLIVRRGVESRHTKPLLHKGKCPR